MYIVTVEAKPGEFPDVLASIMGEHGLSVNMGHATDDESHTLYAIEGENIWTRIWAQNMPLSGQEDPTICGQHSEPYPDPWQYVVRIEPRLIMNIENARTLSDAIKRDLISKKYIVSDKPLLCGLAR